MIGDFIEIGVALEVAEERGDFAGCVNGWERVTFAGGFGEEAMLRVWKTLCSAM